MVQKCVPIREVGSGNWKEYMWPHQIDKISEGETQHMKPNGGVVNSHNNVYGKQALYAVNATVTGNTFNI